MGKANVFDAPSGMAVPSGFIGLWSGAVNAIPAGWVLCNGTNGTPDLRDRFVVGAGSSYSVGAQGGAAAHTLSTAEMPRHTHGRRGATSGRGYTWVDAYESGPHTENVYSYDIGLSFEGSSQAHENRPPYYALCYIMKL